MRKLREVMPDKNNNMEKEPIRKHHRITQAQQFFMIFYGLDF